MHLKTLENLMEDSRELIDYVANLSRIELAEHERETFRVQIGEILEFIQKLNELDTTGVEPMVHSLHLTNVFRSDEVKPSLERQAALKNAPARSEDSYKVPAILD